MESDGLMHNRDYSQNSVIRQFEKFGSYVFGDKAERAKLARALSDRMDYFVPENEKEEFPESVSAAETKKFLVAETKEQRDLLNFVFFHGELREQVQAEILETIQGAYYDTDIENPHNPFFEENAFVKRFLPISDEDVFNSLFEHGENLHKTPTGAENSADFGFYQNQYELWAGQKKAADKKSALTRSGEEKIILPEMLSRNLKSDVKKSLDERFLAWQLSEIDKRRKAYLKDLYKRIAQFKKLEELLSPFTRQFGRLWDLADGSFDNYGFELLRDFSDLLENDESLKELSDLIGRAEAEKERYEKEMREKIDMRVEFHSKPAYRGQISGLKLSGDISSAVPSELAMFKNPGAKLYFSQKFAEKKLLSYKYENRQKRFYGERSTEEVEVLVKEKEQKGPVIICVDTSGSMSGSPERVAKTITFALAKKCLEEERKCYLISFSTGIEVQNLSDFKKAQGLKELVKFLRKSFNGGTDTEPALRHSLSLLRENGWKNADVLVVSDMVTGDLSKKMTAEIKAQKAKETKFYSLVIGSSGNENVIDVFDENWTYDDSSYDSIRHLVRHMRTIR